MIRDLDYYRFNAEDNFDLTSPEVVEYIKKLEEYIIFLKCRNLNPKIFQDDLKKSQSAVQYYEKTLKNLALTKEGRQEAFYEAIIMERCQIINAVNYGCQEEAYHTEKGIRNSPDSLGEFYFNKIYTGNK